MTSPTLHSTLSDWLTVIRRSKSANTAKTYKTAAETFKRALRGNMPIESLTEVHYETLLEYLKGLSPRTEKQVATIIALFYQYLAAKNICKVNMESIRYMRGNETRKVGRRLRKLDMPALEEIAEKVIRIDPGKDKVTARAKALVLLLARSGLRAFEAVGLKVTDLDGKKMRGVIVGKGDKEDYFLIDPDVIKAIKEYYELRKVKSPYVFVSHSKRSAKTPPRPVCEATAGRDIDRIATILLTREPKYRITAHQFRHYFVSRIWRETGDIELAASLARHDNIATTQGYIHADEKDMNKAAQKLRNRRMK
jgi:integrase